MFRKVKNPCSLSHVDGNVNNCETAREASVGYDVSLYFGLDVSNRLGVANFEVSGSPVFHIKAEVSR